MFTMSVFFLALFTFQSQHYPIVDTNQTYCYDEFGAVIHPSVGDSLFGQDANHTGNQPQYRDHADGTVSDLVTGLMWQKTPGEKMTFDEAQRSASTCRVGGYKDWRLPTIKELYSLILFDGVTTRSASTSKPYIDTAVFDFSYGDESSGERFIDAQYATSTLYTSTTMGRNKTMFGVNFADGRIKGYPIDATPRGTKTFYVRYVRGQMGYGQNHFVDHGDGTISDEATGLMWMKSDSAEGMNWKDALVYAQKADVAGHTDWRLPNAKELQSLVDYSRSMKATRSAAIDPIFLCTEITDEGGNPNYAFYWTSTTHLDGPKGGNSAVYIAFGEALGFMGSPRHQQHSRGWIQATAHSSKRLLDVHGAGAQRSDPKTGSSEDYPEGHGPQGDVRRIENFVRLVRDID